jgi:hypothetical protein
VTTTFGRRQGNATWVCLEAISQIAGIWLNTLGAVPRKLGDFLSMAKDAFAQKIAPDVRRSLVTA